MSSGTKPFVVKPKLPIAAQQFEQQFREGLDLCRSQGLCIVELLDKILASPQLKALSEEDYLTIRLFFEVLQDFARQGWNFEYRADQLLAIPPGAVNGKGADQKEIKAQLV